MAAQGDADFDVLFAEVDTATTKPIHVFMETLIVFDSFVMTVYGKAGARANAAATPWMASIGGKPSSAVVFNSIDKDSSKRPISESWGKLSDDNKLKDSMRDPMSYMTLNVPQMSFGNADGFQALVGSNAYSVSINRALTKHAGAESSYLGRMRSPLLIAAHRETASDASYTLNDVVSWRACNDNLLRMIDDPAMRACIETGLALLMQITKDLHISLWECMSSPNQVFVANFSKLCGLELRKSISVTGKSFVDCMLAKKDQACSEGVPMSLYLYFAGVYVDPDTGDIHHINENR